MLDFARLRRKEITPAELTDGLTSDDLRDLTDEMVDLQLELIGGCDDADVVFEPVDEKAHDPVASTEAEVGMAWTLGHVIVHVTASAEEAAFIAAEMARGVLREGRSRYETPWQTVTTIAQCRDRLEESRRMRLATLYVWPDEPHLNINVEYRRLSGPINPVARFVMGLLHDYDHLDHIREIVRQARLAKVAV